jgi:DNA-binding MarR family transcriptional regulator
MKINQKVQLFVDISRAQSMLSRRFDSSLDGISLNEFIILLNLTLSKDGKMRRNDLAEKVGLTPSGVTRLLLPMEKIGLIKKESDKNDARASFVLIAPGGKRKFKEAMERAEILSNDLLPKTSNKEIEAFSNLISVFVR